MIKNYNPLDFVTKQDLLNLGLTLDEILDSYQPSEGGVFHARGTESTGKTLLIAHYIRTLIDNRILLPSDGVGNLTLKGKYGERYGYQVLKGDDLREYLWDLTHKPYRNKFVIIDEIDSEFPARMFTDREQTEIALRLWHTHKLGNYIFLTSHKGNSTDLIIHLASHYYLYPQMPDFETESLDYILADALTETIEEYTAHDIVKTMLIYNRRELTENTDEEQNKPRPKRTKKQIELDNIESELDIELEWEKGLSIS